MTYYEEFRRINLSVLRYAGLISLHGVFLNRLAGSAHPRYRIVIFAEFFLQAFCNFASVKLPYSDSIPYISGLFIAIRNNICLLIAHLYPFFCLLIGFLF